jgi:predicted nucleic acid-binding protein
MVLVNTSVWVKHFGHGEPLLGELLLGVSILIHPFVLGEIACGTMKHRAHVMDDLAALPSAAAATDTEVLQLIETRRLWGRGIGWVDVHLLASALLSGCRLWTLDERLDRAAEHVGIERFR